MNPLLIAGVVIAATSFGGGFLLSHKISEGEISSLKSGIQEANYRAQEKLNIAIQDTYAAETRAQNLNRELDKSHESFIETTNALHAKLNSVRLFDTNRKSCTNAMSKNTDTRTHQDDDTDSAELSTEFTEFLRSESLRADLAAIDKNYLLEFINRNCGITK